MNLTPFIEIDNFLPVSFQDDIEKALTTDFFPWYWNKSTVADNFYYGDNTNIVESNQFTHTIIASDDRQPSFIFKDLRPIVYFLEKHLGQKIKNIDRMKINLLQPIPNNTNTNHNPPHWDADYRVQPNTISMVYYVHDSDGDTVIFDKTLPQDPENLNVLHRSKPKKGKCIVFPSNTWHASSNPIDSDRRIIINSVLELENQDPS